MDFPKTSNLNFVWTQTLNFLLSVFFFSLFRTAHQISPFCRWWLSRSLFHKTIVSPFPNSAKCFCVLFQPQRTAMPEMFAHKSKVSQWNYPLPPSKWITTGCCIPPCVSSLPMPETDSMKLELQLWERKTMNSPKQVRFYGNRSFSSWESTALTRHEPESKTRQRMTNDGRFFAWGQILLFDCNFFKMFKACVPLLTGTCSSSGWDTWPSWQTPPRKPNKN